MNQNLKEDFLDILLYLFEYYSEDPDRESGSNFEIRKHLLGAGFEENAIDHAMDWVEIFKDSPNKTKIVSPHKLSTCLLYTSPSPRDRTRSRMPSSA